MNVNQYLPDNDVFEDMKLLAEIDNKIELHSLRKKTNNLIDDDLALGVNWFDPTKPNFVDPTKDSSTKYIIVLLVNKFEKKMFVWVNPRNYSANIPGGRPKALEPPEYAASARSPR